MDAGHQTMTLQLRFLPRCTALSVQSGLQAVLSGRAQQPVEYFPLRPDECAYLLVLLSPRLLQCGFCPKHAVTDG